MWVAICLQMAPKRSNIDDTKDVLKGMITGINKQIEILQDFVQKCKNDVCYCHAFYPKGFMEKQ